MDLPTQPKDASKNVLQFKTLEDGSVNIRAEAGYEILAGFVEHELPDQYYAQQFIDDLRAIKVDGKLRFSGGPGGWYTATIRQYDVEFFDAQGPKVLLTLPIDEVLSAAESWYPYAPPDPDQ
jgi:hypothetical protein